MDEKNYSQHTSLGERRARLRELMKRNDATVEDYHTVISGATEKERASLARTLSPTKLVKARGEKAALSAYAVGALTSSVPRAVRLISELFQPLRDENFNIIPEPPMPATEQLWEFLTQGVIERSDEWVLHFVEECSDDWSIRSWTHLNKLMREHSLTSLSPGYLCMMMNVVPHVREKSAEEYQNIEQFFRHDPVLLEREFWDAFTAEGVLAQSKWDPTLQPEYRSSSSFSALAQVMCETFPEIRPRFLDETLKGLLRDYSAHHVRHFYRSHVALQPTPQEIKERFALYLSVLGTAYSPAIAMAQDLLEHTVYELSDAQARELIEVSATVLTRTEKKILRAQIRLLSLLLKVHPECTEQVSQTVQDAFKSMPLDLQDKAQKLINDSVQEPPPPIPQNAAGSITVPDITPKDREPQGCLAPRPSIATDRELMECLAATFHGGDGTDIPRILEYLEHAESLEINDAEQKLLWEARELLIEESFGIYTLSSPNIPYLAIAALIKSGQIQHADIARIPIIPTWYKERLYLSDEHGDPVIVDEQTAKKYHPRPFNVKATGTELRLNERGPHMLLMEQLFALIFADQDAETNIVAAPFAPQRVALERTTGTVLTQYWESLYLAREYSFPLQFPLWVGTDTPDAAALSVEAAAFNTNSTQIEYVHRMVESKYYPSYRTIMGWYGWLMQNNPDIFSAQTMPILVAAIHAHNAYGADIIMRILGDMHRALGAASYSALGLGASAKTTEVRANAAEALASLVDRGMVDTALFAEELCWLLGQHHVMAQRIEQTFRDAASISPLAGWGIMQVLEGILPAVGEVNRGGTLVQLLAQLAGEYGVSIEIPEGLRPKMKGSTVLAKSLRALEKLHPHPTELAEQARDQAQELLDQHRCAQP